jgi:hypothetical protein
MALMHAPNKCLLQHIAGSQKLHKPEQVVLSITPEKTINDYTDYTQLHKESAEF